MAIMLKHMNSVTNRADLIGDTIDDVENLPTQFKPGKGVGRVAAGSTCIIIGTGGEGAMYVLNSAGEWVEL